MGPTASGKTDLILELSRYLEIEIISVDSALVFKDMDIGTAKPSVNELNSIPHHLINIISPLEVYSVAQFITDCNRLIYEIVQRNKIPILVGGSMMYFNGLLNGISVLPSKNDDIRKDLNNKIQTYGLNTLFNELKLIDPISAVNINLNDKQRIIRALEVFYITNKTLSELQNKKTHILNPEIQILNLALIPKDRSLLHERINQRVYLMLQKGLIEEVINLKYKYPLLTKFATSMRCVGYKEVWNYLDNLINYSELILQIQASTRQLAKRQITWLKKFEYINIADNIDNYSFKECFINLKNLIENFYD